MQVEVERKFVCDSNIEQRLNQIGAVSLGQYEIKDQYYDSAEFTLTLKDFWLRKRGESWELKCPISLQMEHEHSERMCSKYREITDLQQIKEEIWAVLKDSTENGSHTAVVEQEFMAWVQDLKLTCFAEFTTTRCSYILKCDGDDVRVDLDYVDFGYCVGEIEVLVTDGDKTAAAVQTIEKTAQKLGLNGEKKTQGKMEVYLQRFHPHHYASLLNAHVL